MKRKLIVIIAVASLVILPAIVSLIWFCVEQYKSAKALELELLSLQAKFTQYKIDNDSVKQLDTKIMGELKNAHIETINLRSAVDAGVVQLLIKTNSIERDTGTTGISVRKAVQLAESARQDYYALRQGIEQNRILITGWQEYYCKVIAPKNQTEYLCKDLSWQ
ncbi:lysis system i-spanin subunit Rz [Orbaceae bacterium ESL0721]|nr:lysis system i-spanin subunit Rz [Orbaceae bacterium ESL0721]